MRRNPLEDPSGLLEEYQAFVKWLETADLDRNFEQGTTETYVALRMIPSVYIKRHGLFDFFPAILQYYRMSAKDRKVMEEAARTTSATSTRVPRQRDRLFKQYRTKLDQHHKYLEVAQRVLAEGTERGVAGRAGSFTITDMADVGPDSVAAVKKAVEEAEKLLRDRNLGLVCYGNINIVNQILGRKTILAHYDTKNDELFVRSMIRGYQSAVQVRTVIHELAHRLARAKTPGEGNTLQKKAAFRKALKVLFQRLQDASESKLEAVLDDVENWPAPGQVLEIGKTAVVVDGVRSARGRYMIDIHKRSDPKYRGTLPLKEWLGSHHDISAFVSPYAATDPEENFCEMVSAWCVDELPPEHVRWLGEALGAGVIVHLRRHEAEGY